MYVETTIDSESLHTICYRVIQLLDNCDQLQDLHGDVHAFRKAIRRLERGETSVENILNVHEFVDCENVIDLNGTMRAVTKLLIQLVRTRRGS